MTGTMQCPALIFMPGLGIIRAERFCEGTLLDFCKNGCIAKWLLRLQEIDKQQLMN